MLTHAATTTRRRVPCATTTTTSAPVTLQPGTAWHDVRVSAAQPLRCFVVPLHTYARVTVTVHELCSRARCVLLLSPYEHVPTADTAVWSLHSPAARRTLRLHPADAHYRVGPLYLCLRYADDDAGGGGGTTLRLRVTLQPTFCALWLRRVRCAGTAATTTGRHVACDDKDTDDDDDDGGMQAWTTCSSLYVGQWRGRERHGQGVAFYCVTRACNNNDEATTAVTATCAHAQVQPSRLLTTTLRERCHVAWSSHSLCDDGSIDDDDDDNDDDDNDNSARLVALRARVGVDVHNALRDRDAAATTAEADVPHWRVLTVRTHDKDNDNDDDMDVYEGAWMADARHGYGVYQWRDAVYVGQWAHGLRHGTGTQRYADGSYYSGQWQHDRRHGHGEALLLRQPAHDDRSEQDAHDDTTATTCIYRGQWLCDRREGDGTLEYVGRDVTIACTWHDGVPTTHVRAHYGNGDVYDGEWLHATGQRHGHGTLTTTTTTTTTTRQQQTTDGDSDKAEVACTRTHTHTWQHDRRVGDGVVCYPHRGVCFRGVWDGATDTCRGGAYHFANGDVYDGDWDAARGVREGRGVCYYANGDVYDGAWHADARDGHGTMRYRVPRTTDAGARANDTAHDAAAYDVYVGAWSRDERSGYGTLTCAHGDVYEGAWAHDKRCGHGTQREADGTYYVGGWRDDYRAGKGVYYKAATRVRYEGTFLHNRLQGCGRSERVVSTRPTTDDDDDDDNNSNTRGGSVQRRECYEGGWLDGQRQGSGTLRGANGDVLHATWHRDQVQDGHVVCDYGAHGGRYEGDWQAGQRHGHGRYTHDADGSVYEGAWVHDAPHGSGRLTRTDNNNNSGSTTTLEGQWCRGVWVDGVGTLTYHDGSVYGGVLVRGVPHGEGTLTYPDGTTFRGTFVHGRYEL